MEALVYLLFSYFLGYGDLINDPIQAGWQGRRALRQFECERVSQAQAHQRFPALVPVTDARATAMMQIDALVCQHRVIADGARSVRDQLILDRLGDEVGELSALAAASGDAGTRWIVDAYYPDPNMVRKIANASRVALVERGLKVSDQAPRLSAVDVEMFRTLAMRDALPLACRRMHETGALADKAGENISFLAIALLHEKESQLHAGTCVRGVFRWLR